MTPRRLGTREKRKILFLSLAVGLTPIVAGLLVLYLQVDKSLGQSAAKATIQGLHKTEAVMDRVTVATREIRYLAGQPCDAALPTLRMEVVSESYLRSLMLLRNNTIYCSSLDGVMSAHLAPDAFQNGKFWLRQGNPTTPDSSILYYRLYNGTQGVAAIVDGQTLLDALDLRGNDTALILELGNAWLDRLGNVRTDSIPENPEHHVELSSTRYGFNVHGGYAKGTVRTVYLQRASVFASSFFLVGLLTGGVFYWVCRRSYAPQCKTCSPAR